MEPQIALRADDEERRQKMNRIETRKVGVPAIHRDNGILLHRHNVEKVDVVHCGGGYADKRRDGALQVQERVHLDGGLRLPEGGPREHREAQVDGRGVEGEERVSQFDLQFLALVQLACGLNQCITEVLINPEVSRLVRVGQGGSGDLSPHPYVIEFLPVGGETRFDVAQAVAPGQLGERHRDELIPAGKGANPIVPLVSIDEFAKRVAGQMGQELGEDRGTRVHGNSPPGMILGGCYPNRIGRN